MPEGAELVERQERDGIPVFAGRGDWVIEQARPLAAALAAVAPPDHGGRLRLDLGGVARLDTAGAWLLHRTCARLREAGTDLAVDGLGGPRRDLLRSVAERTEVVAETLAIPDRTRRRDRLRAALLAPGRAAAGETESFLGFLGLVVLAFGRLLTGRARVPLTSVVHHMQQVWINALPIVGFLTMVVGAAIVFASRGELAKFEAEIYAINLIALAMLREVGVIIAAIVAAGRSGSAFAVELGTMKTRQEMDAMQTMGIDPIEALVLPRLIAIVLAFPFLGFFGDIMGLVGGAISTILSLGLTPAMFLDRLEDVVNWRMFASGMIKTPFLALTIGLIGCWQGLRVEGGVEHLGRRTTTAVVQALFLVLLVDSLFIMLLDVVGL